MDDLQLIGATFAGCTLERLLGRGGMGAVYLGRTANGEARALKFLAGDLAQRPALCERFSREGRALEKIPPHPNVVRVFGVHADELLEQPYLVMEYLDGDSLADVLEARGRLELEAALDLAEGAARGLEALHCCGLVHRDVKPANLQVCSSGQVKVVDLGLAKDMFLSGLTEPGGVVGTIPYMAPEQWEGAPATESSDVFGLGASLYHMLVGRGPFAGDAAQIREQCLAGSAPAIRELAPHVPELVAQVVRRMLSPSPAGRYQRMQDVLEDLQRARRGEVAHAVPHLVRADAPGERWLLRGAKRFSIGRDPDQAIRLEHESVSAHHARISRKAEGFVLRDLRSAHGTRVGGERVAERPAVLADGDRVHVGQVQLVFRDPGSRGQAAYLGDVARATCSPDLLEELAERGDRRVTLWLLESLVPGAQDHAAGRRLVAQLLGPAAAEVEAEVAERSAQRRAERLRWLGRVEAVRPEASPAEWFGWWCQARLRQPVQLAPPAPRRSFVVRARFGGAVREAPCGDVTLVGRDPKCQLVIEGPQVQRLQGMLVRMHRRLIVRAEEGLRLAGAPAQVGCLDPGTRCQLAGVPLELAAVDEGNPDWIPIDAVRFAVLARRGHPSTAAGLVRTLEEAKTDWVAAATALCAGDAARAAPLAAGASARAQARAAQARAALRGLLGSDRGDDLPAWHQLLASRADLGPQLLPFG